MNFCTRQREEGNSASKQHPLLLFMSSLLAQASRETNMKHALTGDSSEHFNILQNPLQLLSYECSSCARQLQGIRTCGCGVYRVLARALSSPSPASTVGALIVAISSQSGPNIGEHNENRNLKCKLKPTIEAEQTLNRTTTTCDII
eukprot:5647362-Pleurochrysis_carterae.AAC.6